MPTFKIKNISTTDLVEPYFKIEIKAGETVELESKLATRVLAVFPYRTKIVDSEGKVEKQVGAKTIAKKKVDPEVKADTEESKEE